MLSIVHRQLAEEVEIELIDMKNENHNNDKHEQRNEFADRTYGVDHGSLLCPAQYHKIEQPNQDGSADDGVYGIAAGEIGREEIVDAPITSISRRRKVDNAFIRHSCTLIPFG